MRLMKTGLSAATVLLAVLNLPVYASPIQGLFNTGEGLTTDQQIDTHYALVDQTSHAIEEGYGRAAIGDYYPIGNGIWLGDSAVSHWLTPTANRTASLDNSSDGIYIWTLSFDLTGSNKNTASLTGRFSADNQAIAYLNGTAIGTASDFYTWHDFSATSDLFVNGINTLQFAVTNLQYDGINPTGLRVEFTSSSVVSVPLVSSAWLVLTWLLAFLGHVKINQRMTSKLSK